MPFKYQFSFPAGHAHLLLESSLGKCRRLLSRCLEDGDEERVGGGEGVRLLVYSTVMDTIMSKVHLGCLLPRPSSLIPRPSSLIPRPTCPLW